MNKYGNLEQLITSKNVCIITHSNPDADAFASSIVLKNIIKSSFKVKRIDLFADFDKTQECNNLFLKNNKFNTNHKKYDVAIMIDCPNQNNLGKFAELFSNTPKKISVDHHITNLKNFDINFVEIISSTSELVFKLAKHIKYKLSNSEKEMLYAGIITDTNNFTTKSVSKKTFQIASELSAGIDIVKIYKEFLQNTTIKGMQALALAINNIATFNHGKILISQISFEEISRYGYSEQDLESIPNKLSNISDVELVCFIYPKKGLYHVSLRATQNYDVSDFAKSQGGGGHKLAAGFESKESLSNLEKMILENFLKMMKKY